MELKRQCGKIPTWGPIKEVCAAAAVDIEVADKSKRYSKKQTILFFHSINRFKMLKKL